MLPDRRFGGEATADHPRPWVFTTARPLCLPSKRTYGPGLHGTASPQADSCSRGSYVRHQGTSSAFVARRCAWPTSETSLPRLCDRGQAAPPVDSWVASARAPPSALNDAPRASPACSRPDASTTLLVTLISEDSS